jgi:hypothetical protein
MPSRLEWVVPLALAVAWTVFATVTFWHARASLSENSDQVHVASSGWAWLSCSAEQLGDRFRGIAPLLAVAILNAGLQRRARLWIVGVLVLVNMACVGFIQPAAEQHAGAMMSGGTKLPDPMPIHWTAVELARGTIEGRDNTFHLMEPERRAQVAWTAMYRLASVLAVISLLGAAVLGEHGLPTTLGVAACFAYVLAFAVVLRPLMNSMSLLAPLAREVAPAVGIGLLLSGLSKTRWAARRAQRLAASATAG